MPSPGSKRPLSSTERAISPPTKKKVKVEASVTSMSSHYRWSNIITNTTISGQTVANFFKPASQKPTPSQPKKVSWHIVNNSCIVGRYLVGQKGETQKEEQSNEIKIAAFDFVCIPSVIQHLTVLDVPDGSIYPGLDGENADCNHRTTLL